MNEAGFIPNETSFEQVDIRKFIFALYLDLNRLLMSKVGAFIGWDNY